MMAFLQVFFYSIVSAFLMSASMPNEYIPFGSPFLGLFALVPLYTAVYKNNIQIPVGYITICISRRQEI